MSMSDKKSYEEAPFNMSMLFYIELHEIRKMKTKAFLSGNLFGYRDCLEEIFGNIDFKLNKEQREEIQDLFKEANTCLQSKTRDEYIKSKSKLRKIDLALMQAMNKYKMIFPSVEVKGGLANLEAKYGLNGA